MFLGFGINMWMCLVGPLPTPRWFGNLGRLFYIVAVRLTGTVLGNIFLWSGTVFYPYYTHGDAINHISPLADQNIAGAIMMVEESFLTLGLFCWLFLRAAREGEERQDLLDFAQAQGLELSEARAARAVAAGRGAELRRRLEGRTEHGRAEPDARRPPTALSLAHVRRMCDGRGVGRDGLQDLAADPPLPLADAEADARADDRRDGRRGPRLDGRHQRLVRTSRARGNAPDCISLAKRWLGSRWPSVPRTQGAWRADARERPRTPARAGQRPLAAGDCREDRQLGAVG